MHSWPRVAVQSRLVHALPLLVLLAALWWSDTGSAWAHALLVHSDPSPDIILPAAPQNIHLQFSEDLNASASQIIVWDRHRRDLATGHASLVPGMPRRLTVGLKPLPPGTYLVLWTSVSAEDGHVLRGSYLFFVKQRGPGPSLVGVSQGPPTQGFTDALGIASLFAHWVELFAAVTWMGAAAVSTWVFALSTAADAGTIDQERTRLRAFLRVTIVGLIVSSCLVVLLQAHALAGTWNDALSTSTLSSIFAGQFGHLWLVRQAVAVVALVATAAIALPRPGMSPARSLAAAAIRHRPPGGTVLCCLLGLLYLALFAASGHAAGSDIGSIFGSRIVSGAVGADWLHFVGDGFWFGGQTYIALNIIPVLRLRRRPAPVITGFMDVLNRFSPWAYGSIALFVFSGVFAAKIHISSWYAFFHSVYGWALVVKIGLIGCMMLVSAFTVYIVRPHIRSTLDESSGAGLHTVWVEHLVRWLKVNPVLGAGALLASSVMFSYPVPEGLSPAGPPAYIIHLESVTG
ncbi:MAG: copper resistance protein CopC/CopD, partial [Actinomycetota bacterium]|nr:copper resistance protein CopC/CopD [Actinomycetota bacterium]